MRCLVCNKKFEPEKEPETYEDELCMDCKRFFKDHGSLEWFRARRFEKNTGGKK